MFVSGMGWLEDTTIMALDAFAIVQDLILETSSGSWARHFAVSSVTSTLVSVSNSS
jgi:hypothetical protein